MKTFASFKTHIPRIFLKLHQLVPKLQFGDEGREASLLLHNLYGWQQILLRLCLCLAIILLSGCFKKPQSVGDETHLPVIADPENQEALESIIREVFEKVIMTPQPEKVFEIYWVPLEEHQKFLTRRNLVLIGILNSEGEISARVAKMLSPDVRSRVQEGNAFYFTKEDAYAEGQLLMVFASNSLEELQKNLSENEESLRDIFEKKLIEDTAAKMFEKLEQKEIGEKFLNEYGWSVRVQHDYVINIERVQNQFVMLRRSLPGRERWLFVHWIENAEPDIINEEWAIKTRNKLTEKFYKGDIINEKFMTAKEVNFSNRSAIMLEGLWDNEVEMAGGPFRNYTFYDEPSGRIYMIDAAVFYPGGKKEPFLRQLDVMAHTFKTAEEIASEADKEAS